MQRRQRLDQPTPSGGCEEIVTRMKPKVVLCGQKAARNVLRAGSETIPPDRGWRVQFDCRKSVQIRMLFDTDNKLSNSARVDWQFIYFINN
jgi:hypothetical protein